jgi:hypothetical protein
MNFGLSCLFNHKEPILNTDWQVFMLKNDKPTFGILEGIFQFCVF